MAETAKRARSIVRSTAERREESERLREEHEARKVDVEAFVRDRQAREAREAARKARKDEGE
jgi:hypothetical protein